MVLPFLIFDWRYLTFALGVVRLFWDSCPFCNNSVSACYGCPVCHNYQAPFPPKLGTKKAWKVTFWNWIYRPDQWTRSKIG